MAALFVPLSFVLVQCGKAPSAGNAGGELRKAQNPHCQVQDFGRQDSIDTFEDRFPKPQFADRFPTANESLPQVQRQVALAPSAAAHGAYT